MNLRRVIILVLALFSFNYSLAESIAVKVFVDKIEAKKLVESGGDELYFSLAMYSNKHPSQMGRVPEFPTHWLSRDLPKLPPTLLWEYNLAKDEAIQLIVSLIEADSPPWDPDEHLGSAEVQLSYVQGRFLAEWGQPNFVDQPEVKKLSSGKSPRYVLKGYNGEYYVDFRVEYTMVKD